jgi:2-polyprenyl-6-methoxyphenol hydroxylase-like FAD-dependent oxidoreductase
MAEILTDIHNRLHGNTMPAGLVRPEIWKRQVANTLPHMAGPLAELISATHQTAVFVTKVHDALCQAPVLCDGKVILVGDALAAFRPHFALTTEQAARHCLALAKVQEGEKSLDQWARGGVGIWEENVAG